MGTKIYFTEYGDPAVLRRAPETLAPPARGQVRVTNRAIGVNPADWMVVAGLFRHYLPLAQHPVPGVESAGVIAAVGPGVRGLAVGDHVIRQGSSGAYRQEGNYAVAEVRRKPETVDFEQAAVLTVAGGTAYSAVRQLELTRSDTLLVHAAAGGVGSAAVQIATALGARVIATASPVNHDYLRSLGAEPVSYGPGLADRVRALGPITASFDAAGIAESVATTTALLPDLSRAATALGNPHADRAGIRGISQAHDRVTRVLELAEQQKLTFAIGRRFALADAAQALDLSRRGHLRGKLILVP